MSDDQKITQTFLKHLKSDRTLMLRTASIPARPMTAIMEDDQDHVAWVFSSVDTAFGQEIQSRTEATGTFCSKGHDIFATVTGTLTPDHDRAVIERLWNPFVAAWYEGGKDDPKLRLFRFDLNKAEIWSDASSLMAGVKILMGIDPKDDYKDKKASVTL
ncbi:MAG: pyridoxamine 5'-phosphate oxidase family protein [Asticcacaulis sp.]